MKTKNLHYLSGIVISIFIGVHLFNHLVGLWGAEAHLAMMDRLRTVYRNPLVEGLLLAAVLTQIISGIRLFLRKRKTGYGSFEKLQIWSGLYLAVFFMIHVGAVLTGRYILQLDTNFYFGVAGLNTFPLNLFFIPYYGLAIVAFFSHVAAIHNAEMKTEVLGLTVDRQAKIIVSTGVVIMIVTLYGLTNGFAGFEIPEEYSIFQMTIHP